jgi:hypothetical protein
MKFRESVVNTLKSLLIHGHTKKKKKKKLYLSQKSKQLRNDKF